MHTKLVINLYKENINGLTIILWAPRFPPRLRLIVLAFPFIHVMSTTLTTLNSTELGRIVDVKPTDVRPSCHRCAIRDWKEA